MSDITLITPPDHVYNDNYSFLLIYPSIQIKDQFNSLLSELDGYYNVYLYEALDDEHNPDWLLGTAKQVDCIILDIDNCPSEVKELSAYFLSNPRTFWLTQGEQIYYNKISNKRIYNLDGLLDSNGGKFETTKTI